MNVCRFKTNAIVLRVKLKNNLLSSIWLKLFSCVFLLGNIHEVLSNRPKLLFFAIV